MSSSGFTGLSYPFRVNSQGGAVTSTTSRSDNSHIEDSIRQILGTYEYERPMETSVYSNIDTALFEPNDEGIQSILINIIAEDLNRLEDRIYVEEDDISLSVDIDSNGVECLYATITYKVLKYNSYATSTINLGEVKS